MLGSVLTQISSDLLTNTWYVLWLPSFVFALILAFPPSKLKFWRRYLAALFFYILIQVVLIIITIESIGRTVESGDDGAALMLLPGLMAFPSILMLFLLILRGFIWLARILWRYIGNRNVFSS